MRKLYLKKCEKCGSIIKLIEDKNSSISCCGTKMSEIKENSIDASSLKHIPTYEIKDDNIIVTVNHVMDSDHYIEWICFVNEEQEKYVYLKPNSDAKATFKYSKGALYSYCNKHGLWMKNID